MRRYCFLVLRRLVALGEGGLPYRSWRHELTAHVIQRRARGSRPSKVRCLGVMRRGFNYFSMGSR